MALASSPYGVSPCVTLSSGHLMPVVGYGSFLADGGVLSVRDSIVAALRAGYRAFDCARIYGNEHEVGEGLRDGMAELGLTRQNVFVTSKVPAHLSGPGMLRACCLETLRDLKLDFLDLYLIHQPVNISGSFPNGTPRHEGYGMQDIWRAMEGLVDTGLVRSIGVSNFNGQMLNDCLAYSRIKPVTDQIERHPYLQQQKLVDFAKKYNVVITAYSNLGSPAFAERRGKPPPALPLLQNPVIARIAEKHHKTASQVLLRWSLECGVNLIPKSTTPSRIVENFNIFDFSLDADDMRAIAELDHGYRQFDMAWVGVPTFE